MSLALSNMYVIRKNCALWQIVLKSSGVVQFSSLSKTRCHDWLASNFDTEFSNN